MAKAYPQELRDRVLAAYGRGMKTQQIAEVFAVSKAWARRVKQRMQASGETTPRPRGGARNLKIDPGRLRELVAEHPDATAAEYHAMRGIDCRVSAVDSASRRHDPTYKKDAPEVVVAAEQDRPDVKRGRELWKARLPGVEGDRFVFIDQTPRKWAKTNMPRTHGRAPKGERLIAKTPHFRGRSRAHHHADRGVGHRRRDLLDARRRPGELPEAATCSRPSSSRS